MIKNRSFCSFTELEIAMEDIYLSYILQWFYSTLEQKTKNGILQNYSALKLLGNCCCLAKKILKIFYPMFQIILNKRLLVLVNPPVISVYFDIQA